MPVEHERITAADGSGVGVLLAPVVLVLQLGDDGVQRDVGKTIDVNKMSISSWSGYEARPETCGAPARFGSTSNSSYRG